MCPPPHACLRRALAAALAVTLLFHPGASPALAQAEDPPLAPPTSCWEDPAGDAGTLTPGADPAPSPSPADVSSHCAGYAASLRLAVVVAEPRDPATDPGWRGATAVAWAIDTNADGAADRQVAYYNNAPGALVADVRDPEGTVVCEATASFSGSRYEVSGIPASCLGDASTIAVSPIVFYDTDGDGSDSGDVVVDRAPNGAAFEAPLSGGQTPSTARLAGPDRFATAVEISRAQFPVHADVVYLADSDGLADAVSGGSLRDGPILLVPPQGDVPDVVAGEVNRLNPDQVVALGGESAVPQATLDALGEDRETERIAGFDRVGTAAAIARRAFPDGAGQVFLARADLFADAVVAGGLTSGPTLLVPSCDTVPETVTATVATLGAGTVTALGGEQAVCGQVLSDTAGERQVSRIAAASRIGTATAISAFEFPARTERVYLARADAFADAVVAGVLTGGPVLLVPQCDSLPAEVIDELQRRQPQVIVALGGPAAVCDEVLEEAARV